MGVMSGDVGLLVLVGRAAGVGMGMFTCGILRDGNFRLPAD